VDIISLSMGGLVVRSYLAGKQTTPEAFSPPSDPKLRKWISIATPNFGAFFGGPLFQFAPDEQVREMLPDSQFVFDLATWNQGHDDLRGVDAVAVAASARSAGPAMVLFR
jgi:triacylglycerol esterase/lipase EstA (alpha/beta hydrolase family)